MRSKLPLIEQPLNSIVEFSVNKASKAFTALTKWGSYTGGALQRSYALTVLSLLLY